MPKTAVKCQCKGAPAPGAVEAHGLVRTALIGAMMCDDKETVKYQSKDGGREFVKQLTEYTPHSYAAADFPPSPGRWHMLAPVVTELTPLGGEVPQPAIGRHR
jgi:hypothetical protein